jgi:RimJ/RimL family protein N-acetyltransferase
MSSGPARVQREIVLRPWRPEEADWYVAALDDEIVRWTRESPAMDRDQCAAILQTDRASQARSFAVVDTERGEPVGNLGVNRRGTEVELSYWIAAGFRGRGAATAALVAGTSCALQDPAVASCFLLIHPDNAASIRVAKRAGYAYDGTRIGPAECSGEDGLVAVYRYHR